MSSPIRVDRDVPLEMRDGVILRADVFRPDDGRKYPAIVVRTPYDKLTGGNSDYLSPMNAAMAGYAFVVQDVRGRYTSGGEFATDRPPGWDGYDTIEGLAAEPWCDGNVGMMGGSFVGALQWQTAMENPPHLKAMAPSICTSGPLSETRMAGCVELEQGISWFAGMAVDMLDRMEQQGKDVAKARETLDHARFNLEEVYNYLPINEIPHFQFEGLAGAFGERMKPDFSRFKTEEDLSWDYGKVHVPCLHASGWYDLFGAGLFTNFNEMREKGGSDRARQGQHLICGPWIHGRSSLFSYTGGLHFGPAASWAGGLIQERHVAFFDEYLKGMDSIFVPAIRYFVMGLNRWKEADSWPLPQTDWQRFYLHGQGRANTAAGNGLLTRDEPVSEPPDRFIYDPMFPVPTRGGNILPSGTLVPGPFDQTLIERREDVLCYTSPECREPFEVTGPLTLHLFASTSVKDTDFTVKLVDIYPDGSAYNVAEGCIRAQYRESVLAPREIVPGEVYEYTINMGATSIQFGKGHRLRIDVSSSNFPRIDRNMNTGNPFGEDREGIPAMQTVFHDHTYPSYIDLPVIPGKE
ncbi:MAG: CocE/NonD family hydrolase [Deltaproteobacteria bacterium]|nr:CocE/NonD family hydrolase [Deltaproteobacteria bacterium]